MPRYRLCWLGLALMVFLGGCTRSAAKPIERTAFLLDTTVTISLYQPQDPAVLDGCIQRIQRYEQLFSRTVAQSDIGRLNVAGGQPVTVSADTAALLQAGIRYSELSGGAFDCTIAPAAACWDFTAEPPQLPDAAALANAAEQVDYRRIRVEGTQVQLDGAQTQVDLGGIAKGYIADRLRDYLLEQGVESALINLGGNVLAVGQKDKTPWKIGIRDPLGDGLAAVITLKEGSVVTSGAYERGFTLDGVRYHHILDPETGWPVNNGLASVTIVSAQSVDGDALSTACFVLGLEKGKALVESLDGIEALFIHQDGTLTATPGLRYEVP